MQGSKAAERLYIQRILTLDIQTRYKAKLSVSLPLFLRTNFKDRESTDPLTDTFSQQPEIR